jgi:tetratricopeptide (TPR) repeat protein
MKPGGAAQRAAWVAPLVLVLAVACVFGRSVGFGFVIWDDPGNVAANPLLDPPSLASLGRFWTGAFEHSYAPLSYSVWWTITLVSRFLFGRLEPALFHAANVVLHALSVLLVFRWLCLLVLDRRAAWSGALLFALHPLHVESVCWITELRGLLSAALGFGALLLVLHGRPRMAVLLFALALLAKPAAVAFAALLCVQEIGLRRRPWREVLGLHWPWLVLAASAGFLARQAESDVGVGWITPLLDRPVIALDALGFYLAKLVWPVGLCAEYGRNPQLVTSSLALWPAALALALALGAAWAFPERRRALCALFCFGAALLPVLGLVPFGYQEKSTVADRYAYVALVGAALGAALLVARFGLPALAGALALALVCGALSFVQAANWRDTQALFGRVLEINPRSTTAHENLGVYALERRDLDAAREHFLRSLELDPERKVLSNLGAVECELGRFEEGLAHLREAIARKPRSIPVRKNLIAGLVRAGRLEEAEAAARELAALGPP